MWWRYNVFSCWRRKFKMLSLQSAITVYFYRIRVESTPHIISLTPVLVTGTQSSNWTKIWKWLLLFRAKALTRRRKRKKGNYKAFCVTRKNTMIGKRLVEWQIWFLIYFPTKHFGSTPLRYHLIRWVGIPNPVWRSLKAVWYLFDRT